MTTTTLAVLVPLLPFLGAAAGLLLGRTAPGYVRPLAVLPPLTSLVLAVLVAVRQGGDQAINAATELTPTGSVPVELALHIDGFAALVAVLVGVVASCVQIYSTGYLRDDPRYPSYAALVSLFTSAMLLVVYSGDLIVLLVGWEVMGICSYFLVGHYWETPRPAPPRSRHSLSPSSATSPSSSVCSPLPPTPGLSRSPRSSAPSRAAGCTIRRWSPCCSSPVRRASRRCSLCTPGCPTRWRARHPSPR